MDYDFPGNVRELENIIERGVALAGSNIILPESLSLKVSRRTSYEPGDRNASLFLAVENEQELFDTGLDKVIADLRRN